MTMTIHEETRITFCKANQSTMKVLKGIKSKMMEKLLRNVASEKDMACVLHDIDFILRIW